MIWNPPVNFTQRHVGTKGYLEILPVYSTQRYRKKNRTSSGNPFRIFDSMLPGNVNLSVSQCYLETLTLQKI